MSASAVYMNERDRQRAIIDYIQAYWAENWISPTVGEIGKAVGLSSKSSVHAQLMKLVAMGALERNKLGRHRVLYRVPLDGRAIVDGRAGRGLPQCR